MKTKVVFWSQTGNTEAMAEAVAKGAGCDAVSVDSISVDELKEFDGFALGCPAMGDEVLEEAEFEPFFEELEKCLDGKKVAIFGSYDWGDGQWMRDWEERVKEAGADLIGGEGLILQNTPDDDGLAECEALGASLVG